MNEDFASIIASLRRSFDAVLAAKDSAYAERNACVSALAHLALALGWPVGIGRHDGADWEDDWRTTVFIDTPAGQVSWHFHDREWSLIAGLPRYPGTWDGHDTPEKYRRLGMASVALLIAEAEETPS